MKKKKILIIDDQKKEFDPIKNWLNKIYPVLPEEYLEMARAADYNCGGEGIEEYVKRLIQKNYQDIGLILCDIVYGEGEDPLWGCNIIKSIREIELTESPYWASLVPIIAFTQFADDNLIGVSRDGADIVISKPKNETDRRLLRDMMDSQINKFEKYINMTKKDRKKVFIIHGHDGEAKANLELFLRRLDLEAIVLHKQANGGDTIIEKIEHHTDVGYAVVLYTDCDLGRGKNETNLKPRARQNVVFEHGYLMSKLGRKKVCALVGKDKDGNIVERPGDMSGVVYIPLDDEGAWKMKLVKELLEQGIDVNLNGGIEDI